MDEFDPTFLTVLVGQIDEAAVDPNRLDDFLGTLESIYPGSRVTLFGHENGRPVLTLHRNFASDELQAYRDYYVGNSPYAARGLLLPVGQPILSEVVIEDRELKTTEHYNDFVKPRRVGYYAAGAIVERRPDRVTALSLSDHKNDMDRRAR